MAHESTRAGMQHPEEWRYDLNPTGRDGSLEDPTEPGSTKTMLIAYDIKDLHHRLPGFSDDELKQIPVLPEGSQLSLNGTYIDLRDPERREFTATGDMTVPDGSYYVPKSEVDYVLWNRLIGVINPARLDQTSP